MGYNAPKQTVSQFQLKGRYARQYLSFAGKSSKDFLLYLSGSGVYDSPAADVESTSVPGRNGDILTENAKAGRRRYQNVDIKYKAFFFNGLPAKTAAVKAWLLSPVGYQKLQDTYDPDFFRMAVCKDALAFDVTAQKAAEMELTFKLKEAVERGRQKTSPEVETYERLVEDLRIRLDEKQEERQQLSQEELLLSEMKNNYEFFIRCLEALPEVNKAGMKLNVNGLDTDGSCLRDLGGKARSKIMSDIRRGKRKMGADRVEQAPDFLEFEKGIYFAFVKEGIVDGDVITYMTNFGVKLTSTGNSRTLMAFIGFRRCNPNKTVEVLMDGWQVNGLCIRYYREKRKEKTANTLMIRKRKAQEREVQEQEA